jgi:hypothetical protein
MDITTTTTIESIIDECIMSTTYKQEMKDSLVIYLNELTEIEKIAILIAKEHLETSFDISKSVGFREWLKK